MIMSIFGLPPLVGVVLTLSVRVTALSAALVARRVVNAKSFMLQRESER